MSRLDPSPTLADIVRYTVTFSESVTGVDASDFLAIAAGNISGAAISQVTGSGTAYTVAINSGFGDGTLGLSLTDNDSIVNAGNTPLGGTGAGNGNYTASDVYTIDKNIPSVTGALRTDPNPSTANEVHFSVTFSEPVNGVDARDFLLTPTGGIAGLQLTGVTAISTSQYSVTVTTGTGSGTIRLDVIDNDSINMPHGRVDPVAANWRSVTCVATGSLAFYRNKQPQGWSTPRGYFLAKEIGSCPARPGGQEARSRGCH